eukprot:Nitzschia sp. Nitz4//scaffold20_size174350//115706//117351//NITZ4_002115-RA/size174350-augustus-gene-0.54-mRNA-1//-1//CDS//3329541848//8292//frame0
MDNKNDRRRVNSMTAGIPSANSRKSSFHECGGGGFCTTTHKNDRRRIFLQFFLQYHTTPPPLCTTTTTPTTTTTMIFQWSLCLSVLLTGASAGSLRATESTMADVKSSNMECPHMKLFKEWSVTHEKEYESDEHFKERMSVWMNNNKRIEEHNAQVPEPSYLLGHNEYSDMTQEEFAQHFKLGRYSNVDAAKMAQAAMSSNSQTMDTRHLQMTDRPEEVNWVGLGGVTPVKNQGSCGSCWAFSTTGALEGAKFVRTGELVALSEQNLLDCDHQDLGCNGGLMDNAFKFDEKTGGLCSEADYPYMAKQGTVCNPTNCTDVPGTIVSTFYDVPTGDADALMAAISMQPISIAVQADQFAFQFYKTGVLTDESCGERGEIDHGVLAAGYGTDSETGEPYWLVKNSWGATWGENGYIRMSRNSTNEWGMCAILKMASYPEVE